MLINRISTSVAHLVIPSPVSVGLILIRMQLLVGAICRVHVQLSFVKEHPPAPLRRDLSTQLGRVDVNVLRNFVMDSLLPLLRVVSVID